VLRIRVFSVTACGRKFDGVLWDFEGL